MVGELQPGALPFSVALGPTYLHEERQVVGLVRLRAIAHSSYVLRRNQPSSWLPSKNRQRVNADHASSLGPTLELSTESRDMRLRHARMRWDYRVVERYAGRARGRRGVASFSVFAEASVFRSRAFLDSLRPGDPDDTALARVPTGSRRATAWGFGGGASGMLQLGPGTLGLDLHAGVNRPELLALMPSAAQHFELQGLITTRVEY